MVFTGVFDSRFPHAHDRVVFTFVTCVSVMHMIACEGGGAGGVRLGGVDVRVDEHSESCAS